MSTQAQINNNKNQVSKTYKICQLFKEGLAHMNFAII